MKALQQLQQLQLLRASWGVQEDMNQDDFVRNFELSESDDDEAEEA